ncbi:hypothetical protein [Pleionea sediminis]|uniref:hypothetical protein n=1 Tax=Pleionea sediminis TaxID=2569479 RepID=UPI0011846B28|nr:hypothetical protein [Pleionea sediminis]
MNVSTSQKISRTLESKNTQLQNILDQLPGKNNLIHHDTWRFEAKPQGFTADFTSLSNISIDFNTDSNSKAIAKSFFLFMSAGKNGIVTLRNIFESIIKIFFYLHKNKINTINKNDLKSYLEYILSHSMNNGVPVPKVTPLSYHVSLTAMNTNEWNSVSKIHGLPFLFDQNFSNRMIHKRLKFIFESKYQGDLTFGDWKDGGSLNNLTLDYGKFYVEHCANIFDKHFSVAASIGWTLLKVRKISNKAGFFYNDKGTMGILRPICRSFLEGLTPNQLCKRYRRNLGLERLFELHKETIIAFKGIQSLLLSRKTILEEKNIRDIANRAGLESSEEYIVPSLTALVEIYVDRIIQSKAPEFRTNPNPENDLSKSLHLEGRSINLFSIVQPMFQELVDNCNPSVPNRSFFRKFGLERSGSKGVTLSDQYIKLIEDAGATYFVAITGWRESEYGFSIANVHTDYNRDILDQSANPLRFSVKWYVPKTNGDIKLNREISYKAYQTLKLMSFLVLAESLRPCLYRFQSSAKNIYNSAEFMKRTVRNAWAHFVSHYQPFTEISKKFSSISDLKKEPENTFAPDLVHAYITAKTQIERVRFLIEYDKRRNLIPMFREGKLAKEHSDLLEQYLSPSTYNYLQNTESKHPTLTKDVITELLTDCLYPTVHAFRHMWAESVYRRFDGDIGWMIRSSFKHISHTQWNAYVDNKDNYWQHQNVKREVITSIVNNYISKRGHDYSGAFSKLLRRMFLRTHVKTVQEIADFCLKEIIDIKSSPWGYCLLSRRSMFRAKCAVGGIPVRHNATPSLCLGCCNNLTQSGNTEGILLGIANDLSILNSTETLEPLYMASQKVVKKALVHLIDLGADPLVIQTIKTSLENRPKFL